MVRGLYIAAAGMTARQTTQDVIASNLANAATNGFKADRVVFETALERALYRAGDQADPQFVGYLSGGVSPSGTYSDLSAGSVTTTGNPLDVAIHGEGFFAVQTSQGVRYTRDGAFQVNAQGTLVTRQGFPVLGKQGAIQVPPGSALEFHQDGFLLVNGQVVDRLQIVTGRLRKDPSGFFTGNPVPVNNPTVQPEALEQSNISVVNEMVKMIETMRSYEANQKVIHAHDDALGRAVNEIARI